MTYLITLLLLTVSALGAVTKQYDTSFIKSSVTLNSDGLFNYRYEVLPSLVGRRDLSYFEVFFCEEARILSPAASVAIQEELKIDSLKWNITQSGNSTTDIVFTFLSRNTPVEGWVSAKIGNTLYFEKANVPSCVPLNIPEPSTLLSLMFGFILILRRQRPC